jgi:hypothetical protein
MKQKENKAPDIHAMAFREEAWVALEWTGVLMVDASFEPCFSKSDFYCLVIIEVFLGPRSGLLGLFAHQS